MIDYKNFDLYTGETVDKQLKITFDSGTITNTEIPSEQFELTESLTSESQLVFGSCEASEIKFRIYNVFLPLKDKWLTVTQTLNGDTENPLQIGKYKVYSDKPTADRGYRDIVAYDSMYDIINTDVASWYNGLTFPMSLKAFRDSFFAFFGIGQENVSLVNDLMIIERTIEPSVLSGKDVIQSICEINGCFGHIGRDGKFQYIHLENSAQGLYPSNDLYPAEDLFPIQSASTTVEKSLYISCEYEDFISQSITKLQIREKEGDVGGIAGEGDNSYIIEDNFLLYGKSTDELNSIAAKTLEVIGKASYRPFKAEIVGNPCFEVGDAIRLFTKYEIIETYILNRTLSGIQGLRDDFSADGEEYFTEKVNDIQTSITQLKGKTNTLERTIEETRSTITDVESGLQSQITQTAESITSTVGKGQSKWDTSGINEDDICYGYGEPTTKPDGTHVYYLDVIGGFLYTDAGGDKWDECGKLEKTTEQLYSEIRQTAESITQTVEANYETKTDAGKTKKELQSEIKQTADEITQNVSATYETIQSASATKAALESQIEQTAESITSTVSATYETKTDARQMKNDLQTSIEQTASSITQTVSAMQTKWDTSKYSDKKIYIGYEDVTNVEVTPEQKDYDLFLNSNTGVLYEKYVSGVVEGGGETYSWRPLTHLSTVEENLSSQIEQTAESITSTVASSQIKWDTAGVKVSIYGYGSPEEQYNPFEYSSLYYLDQSNGYLYLATTTEWIFVTELELITDELSSQIQQTAGSIELKVSKGDVSTELSLENEQVSIKGDRLVVESTNFSLDENGNVGLTGSVHATEFNVDEKITLKSGWVFDSSGATFKDVLYTEQETIGARVFSLIHAAISYIEGQLTINGILNAMYGIHGGVTHLTELTVSGTKSRLASTENYNDRLLYCYEMPSPFFGDIGHGTIGEDGLCYVDIDSIFAETIDTIQEYYVFLTPYKTDKAMFIQEKEHGYFVVQGEPGTEFDWEIKAKQSDFPMERLEENVVEETTNDIDYEQEAINYLNEYEKELTEV